MFLLDEDESRFRSAISMETKRADIDTIKCINGVDICICFEGKEMPVCDVFARNRVWTNRLRINELTCRREMSLRRADSLSPRLFHVCLSKPVPRGFLTCVCLFGQQPINRTESSNFRYEKFQISQVESKEKNLARF